MVAQNPRYPDSKNIIEQIVPIEVTYTSEDGIQQTGFIEINRSVGDEVQYFFETALELRFPFHQVDVSSSYKWDDTKLITANITSGFNYRTIAASSRLSLHSYGLAFDVNPRLNPYIRYVDGHAVVEPEGAEYNPKINGTLTAGHPLVILMKSIGWEWGGDWSMESGRTDYQHFQKLPPKD